MQELTSLTTLCASLCKCMGVEPPEHADKVNDAFVNDITGGKLNAAAYGDLGGKVMGLFPNIKYVAFTLRESISASENNWSAVLVDKTGVYQSKKYHLTIVDRVGGGDSFGAGLIFALSSGRGAQEAVELAVAASAIKHTVEGDFNVLSLKEVEKLMGGDASGRVQR